MFAVAETEGADVPLLFAAVGCLLVPVAIGAVGVRQLRRWPRLPELAVTITPAAVLFPAIDRPSGLAARIRAAEWDSEGLSAAIIPASAMNPARVEFSRHDGRKRYPLSVAAGNLDVDPLAIVEALRNARRS